LKSHGLYTSRAQIGVAPGGAKRANLAQICDALVRLLAPIYELYLAKKSVHELPPGRGG